MPATLRVQQVATGSFIDPPGALGTRLPRRCGEGTPILTANTCSLRTRFRGIVLHVYTTCTWSLHNRRVEGSKLLSKRLLSKVNRAPRWMEKVAQLILIDN